jgi:hypothetical protein
MVFLFTFRYVQLIGVMGPFITNVTTVLRETTARLAIFSDRNRFKYEYSYL